MLWGALALLNDYIGYRPIAVLETRPNTEYYPHEKVRPVPSGPSPFIEGYRYTGARVPDPGETAQQNGQQKKGVK